jgi:hypothetical protein
MIQKARRRKAPKNVRLPICSVSGTHGADRRDVVCKARRGERFDPSLYDHKQLQASPENGSSFGATIRDVGGR